MQLRFVVLMFAAGALVLCGTVFSAFRYEAAPPVVVTPLLQPRALDDAVDGEVGHSGERAPTGTGGPRKPLPPPHVAVDADAPSPSSSSTGLLSAQPPPPPPRPSNRTTTSATTSTATTLSAMLRACESNKQLLKNGATRTEGRTHGVIATPFTSYAVNPSLTCVSSGSPVQYFYAYDHRHDQRAPANDDGVHNHDTKQDAASFLSATHMSGADAAVRPLQTEEDLEAALSTDTGGDDDGVGGGGGDALRRRRRSLRFHNRLAVLLTATWNSVNWYHLLMDQLIGLAYTDRAPAGRGPGGLGQLPRTVVHIINSSWNTKWGKADQQACFDFSAAFSNDHTPSIAVRTTSTASTSAATATTTAAATSLHCFCQAVVVGEHRLPRGAPHRNFTSTPRQLAIAEYKRRMVAHFGERPYGEVPQVTDFTKYGYWRGGGNASVLAAPRLLFVKRHRRRIGHSEGIEALAEALGFNVAAVYFEELSPAVQFHLSRYADVLMGIHGMALTYVANMDGGGGDGGSGGGDGSRSCRTLIELMHWVNPTKFWYYQEMAPINSIHLHRVLPVDVLFGPSVLHKAKEKKLLMKNIFWWGQKGFDDQTAFFDMGAVRHALVQAATRFRQCAS